MAVHCGNCNSTECTHGADSYTCLSCGARTSYDGDVVAGPTAPEDQQTGEPGVGAGHTSAVGASTLAGPVPSNPPDKKDDA